WRTKPTTTPPRLCAPCSTGPRAAGRRPGARGSPTTTSWRTSCARLRRRSWARPGGCSPSGSPS
ncbi:MAG: hypothetical protein AVDCRST_MAG02-2532, partial [uncultured Rubrobacteraceae bacterium]